MIKAKSLFAMLKERVEPKHDVEFIASSGSFNDSKIIIHYIILKWWVCVADVNAAEEFLEALGIVEEAQVDCWGKLFIRANIQYGWNLQIL